MGMNNVLIGALLMVTTMARGQVLDRVIAVVDNDIVLESELNAQVQFLVFNNRLDPETPGLKEQVLQSMINEKLIVAQAIEDSVTVSDEEVQQQLENTIQQRIQQVGSESKLEELYNMPISKIKREFRDEMRKSLLANKLQQQRFGITQISRREVEDFFSTFKDSLGSIPEEVELAHIYIEPKPSAGAKALARARLQDLLDSIKAGADFAGLATRHSQDPGSAVQGGDLGFVRRGLFVPEFEAVVFSMTEGQLSGVVETKHGMHIIELLERRGESVRARHILLRVERTPADEDSVTALLHSLRTRALAGEDFAVLAKKYSEDKETAPIGGSLGTADLEQIEAKFYSTVVSLKEGEISEPVPLKVGGVDGYHIVVLKKRTAAHAPTLQQDYQRIESIAKNFKRNKEYQDWLEELKGKIYWQSRL